MSNAPVKTVGVAGLGIIGSRVAANLRAKGFNVKGLVVPTAGTAGAAMAAYSAAARIPARVYAPSETPATILKSPPSSWRPVQRP